MFDALVRFDQRLLMLINGIHCPIADEVMWQISSRLLWLPLYAVIIFFFVRSRKKEVWITLLAVALMIVLSDQISGLIKDSVQRLRPTHTPSLQGLLHTVHNYFGGNYGFVSSHAANSFAVAVFVGLFFRQKWITISIFCWAVLVSYSRMYLGVHYPLDILGGAFVGVFCGFLLSKAEVYFYQWRLRSKALNQK